MIFIDKNKRKKAGVKGRSSKQDIELRSELIIEFFDNHTNRSPSRSNDISALYRYLSEKISPKKLPGKDMIRRQVRQLIDDGKLSEPISLGPDDRNGSEDIIYNNLAGLYLSVRSRDYEIYPELSPKLINFVCTPGEDYYSSYIMKRLTTLTKGASEKPANLLASDLVHALFCFDIAGLEAFTAAFLDDSLPKEQYLYINSYKYACELVFRFSDIHQILPHLTRLVKFPKQCDADVTTSPADSSDDTVPLTGSEHITDEQNDLIYIPNDTSAAAPYDYGPDSK